MKYRELAEDFLNMLYKLGKQGKCKDVTASMRGENMAVLYLSMCECTTPGELAEVMQISSARVAALLNTMEKKQLILRSIDPNDRRKILVSLTEKGREKAQSCKDDSLVFVSLLMERLGEEDSVHLVRIIEKVTEIAGSLPEREEKGKEREHDFED